MKIIKRLQQSMDTMKAIQAYNSGLDAKCAGHWKRSLFENQRANELRPNDEATLWNLGIAATALHEWDIARRAWTDFGIRVNGGPGEVRIPEMIGCVRLDPNGAGEVVWGTRIDPARTVVNSVPLPESGRRFRDIVLNDGAPEGNRVFKGTEYPVFNELGMWQMSGHSTFGVALKVPNENAAESLMDRCHDADIGVEDWATMRILCEACSRGTPGEHDCIDHPNGQSRYGFGAKSEAALRRLLHEWIEVEDGAAFGDIELLLSGVS